MSGNDDGGRTLGGEASEPLPQEWRSASSAPRVGRIGDWSASNQSRPAGGHHGHGHDDDDGDDDNDDDEENEGRQPQSWFTGGERSGLSVQNPDNRRAVPGGNMVRDLLRRAADAGPAPSSQPQSGVFSGSAHTLGSDEVESQFIPDPTHPFDDSEPAAIRNLTLWSEGFSIDDGELMPYGDPANDQILAEINAGRAPPHILNVLPGQPVDLRVAKRFKEKYQPPPKRAFAGAGNRLGAPVPTFNPGVPAAMPGEYPSTGVTSVPSGSNEAGRSAVSTKFEVDQEQPTTSLQIRLADGTRMISRMNLTHTVQDLRNFINASRAENLNRPYTIGTAFPTRTLEDETQTIEAAGLVNSVVIQRWI